MKIVKHNQSFYTALILGVALMFCLFGVIFLDNAATLSGVTSESVGKVKDNIIYQEDIEALMITTDAVAAYLIDNQID